MIAPDNCFNYLAVPFGCSKYIHVVAQLLARPLKNNFHLAKLDSSSSGSQQLLFFPLDSAKLSTLHAHIECSGVVFVPLCLPYFVW